MATYNEQEMLRLLQEASITDYDDVSTPQTLLEFGNTSVGTLGNFSTVIGKAKSKKSFFLIYLMAQVFKSQGIIKCNRPANKTTIAYFDTEQSDHKTKSARNIIAKLAGIDFIGTEFSSYNLRKRDYRTRVQMIDKYLLDNGREICLVIIDGVRDLLGSINDEAQASEVVGKLLSWTQEYDLHIIVVLHMNKNDSNARGHLGTEVINKAETIISVTVEEKAKHISTISCLHARDKEFEPMQITVDEQGIPHMTAGRVSTKPEKQTLQTLSDEILAKIVAEAFRDEPEQQYSGITGNISKSLKKAGYSASPSSSMNVYKECKSRGLISYYKPVVGNGIYKSNL